MLLKRARILGIYDYVMGGRRHNFSNEALLAAYNRGYNLGHKYPGFVRILKRANQKRDNRSYILSVMPL